MLSTREDVVFIAFSDTHGNRKNLSRLYTLIKETIEKDKASNPNVKHVLLIPGDVFSVNAACSVVSNGDFDIETITAIADLFPEDARFFTPGNHDYFYQEAQLLKLVEKAKLKVVVTNTQFTDKSKLKFEKAGFVLTATEAISIAGLMTPETLNTPGARPVIQDEKSFASDPQELRDLGEWFPNIVMSHLGSKSDVALPYKATTIVGGHSHDKQVNMLADKMVVNTGAGECAIVMRHGKAPEIKEVKDCKSSEVIEAIVKRYENKYKLNLTDKIFTVDAKSIKPAGLELAENEVKEMVAHLRTTDSMITRLTADSLAKQMKKLGHQVDFVLYPSAAIRSNFEPGQVVTEEELLETFYYNNKLVEVTLTGAQFVELLAHGVMSGYNCYINRGQLLTPSHGLTYEYDISQANPGDTIRSVKVNGKYINLNNKFVIATTDWVAGDIGKRFPNVTQKVHDLRIYKLVRDEIRNTTQKENFAERISHTPSFQTQHAMTSIPGNLRSDKPKFDKFKVPINFAHHQANYLKENAVVVSKGPSAIFAEKPSAPTAAVAATAAHPNPGL